MKIEQLRHLLEDALGRGKVYLHVNPRVEGVVLPESLMHRERVPLVVAWRAPDIELDLGETVIAATLRFSGKPFRCVIPWAALLAIISDQPSQAETSPRLEVVPGGSTPQEKKPRQRPQLKLLDD